MDQNKEPLMLSLEQGQQRVVLAALEGSEGYYTQMEQYEPSEEEQEYARRNHQLAENLRRRLEGLMADADREGGTFVKLCLDDEEADLLLVELEVLYVMEAHSDHSPITNLLKAPRVYTNQTKPTTNQQED